MPRFSTRFPPSPRLAAIEHQLKSQQAKQKKVVHQSLIGGQLLRVKNSNNTSFVMGMPRGDSPLMDGLARRYFGAAEIPSRPSSIAEDIEL